MSRRGAWSTLTRICHFIKSPRGYRHDPSPPNLVLYIFSANVHFSIKARLGMGNLTASGLLAFSFHSPCSTSSFHLKLLTHSLRYVVSASVAVLVDIIVNCSELGGTCICKAACVANGGLPPYRTRYCDVLFEPLRCHRPSLSPPLSIYQQ